MTDLNRKYCKEIIFLERKFSWGQNLRPSWKILSLPNLEWFQNLSVCREDIIAYVMKHIWSLFTKARQGLYGLLGFMRLCWTWDWRTVLKLRDEARGFIQFDVGDGNRIFLRHNNWHLAGIPLLKLVLESFMMQQVALRLEWIQYWGKSIGYGSLSGLRRLLKNRAN